MEDIKVKLSEEFAVDILGLSEILLNKKCNNAIITQILKSGTSIGANIAESRFAESSSDFVHKLKIAQKEGSETLYWLRILFKAHYLDKSQFNPLYAKCEAIMKILATILKTFKN